MARQSSIGEIVQGYVIPLLLILSPFFPTIYDRLNEPELHFVYEYKYTKNPLLEWNRQIEKFLNALNKYDPTGKSKPPGVLIQSIGKEFYDALPVMAAGIGVRPFDKMRVTVANLTDRDLRNVRIAFSGCTDYDSYETYPDTIGSAENKNAKPSQVTGSITLKYDYIPRTPGRSYNLAYITFYGADASNCKPVVYAETRDGKSAIGKQTNIDLFITDRTWEVYESQGRREMFFKLVVVLGFIFIIFRINTLRKSQR